MPRPKGSQNKVTKEVKQQLQKIIEEVLDSIDLNSMEDSEKLKLLQIGLHYIIPKLRSVQHVDSVQQNEPFTLQILSRKENSNEENWKDNFEVTSVHQVGG